MLAANEMLAAKEVSIIEGGGKLIEKSMELKTGKLSKSQKLSKSKKSLALKHIFIFLRLAFANIWIQTQVAYFLGK